MCSVFVNRLVAEEVVLGIAKQADNHGEVMSPYALLRRLKLSWLYLRALIGLINASNQYYPNISK